MKDQLRSDRLAYLNSLDPTIRKRWENDLHHQFLTQDALQSTQTVGLYYSFQPEIDTHRLIRQLTEIGKTVYLPRIYPNRQMAFHHFLPNDPMDTFFNKGLQPLQEAPRIRKQDLDLIVVPGLAFLSNGHRLGYGGGYYDRYLANYPGHTIAMAFPGQMVQPENWLTEKTDIPVQRILTVSEDRNETS